MESLLGMLRSREAAEYEIRQMDHISPGDLGCAELPETRAHEFRGITPKYGDMITARPP